MSKDCQTWTLGSGTLPTACIVAMCFGLTASVQAQERPSAAPPQILFRDQAVHHALLNNPMLMMVRKQKGYAEADIIVAKTYPFNPLFASPDVANRVFHEDHVTQETELRGQGKIRQTGADATRNRIEAEIAQQEIMISVAVIRAYNAVLYRQKKLELLEQGIRVNEIHVEKLEESAQVKREKHTDAMLARADLECARAQRGQARTALAVARAELRRLLGTLDDTFVLEGEIDVPLPTTDQSALTQLALKLRPDLQARRAAIREAEAALRPAAASRLGNRSMGPLFRFDSSRFFNFGARLATPAAASNTRKGEIHTAQTEVASVRSEVQQIEQQVSQDVIAALSRLAEATQWARSYHNDVLPDLTNAKLVLEKMFTHDEGGVDLPRYLAVQRAFLKATENFLDARYEVSQAESDLAQAVADPALALGKLGIRH